jgi:hypothetical protein
MSAAENSLHLNPANAAPNIAGWREARLEKSRAAYFAAVEASVQLAERINIALRDGLLPAGDPSRETAVKMLSERLKATSMAVHEAAECAVLAGKPGEADSLLEDFREKHRNDGWLQTFAGYNHKQQCQEISQDVSEMISRQSARKVIEFLEFRDKAISDRDAAALETAKREALEEIVRFSRQNSAFLQLIQSMAPEQAVATTKGMAGFSPEFNNRIEWLADKIHAATVLAKAAGGEAEESLVKSLGENGSWLEVVTGHAASVLKSAAPQEIEDEPGFSPA